MNIKNIIGSLLIATTLFASTTDEIKIFTEQYPPYNMKSDDKLSGLSVDVLDAMFKQMKSKQNINDITLTNWSRAYSIAKKKKNTMVFSTTRTQSRENSFKWVGPIIHTTVGIIALKDKNIKINKVSDFSNYKIGAVLKDIGETLLLDLGVDKKQIQHVVGQNAINLSFTKMQKNRIDMFAYDTNVAFVNAKNEGFDVSIYEVIYTLKKGELYFAFNKNTDEKIIKKWQKALDTIKSNGIYKKILKKY